MDVNILHILSPLSAPWCGWTMLGLLLCGVLSEFFQPGILTKAYTSLVTKTERTYKESPNTFFGQVFITIFRLGTIAMALCLCLYNGNGFSFVWFAAVCGCLLLVLLCKMLCNVLIDYTFQLTRHADDVYEHFGNIFNLAVLALYPTVLILMRVGSAVVAKYALLCIALLFVVVWMYRCGRIFVSSFKAVGYLMLYIVTLELTPMALVYYLSELMIVTL